MLYTSCKAFHIIFKVIQYLAALLLSFQVEDDLFKFRLSLFKTLFSGIVELFQTAEFVFQFLGLFGVFSQFLIVFISFCLIIGNSSFNINVALTQFSKPLFLLGYRLFCGFGCEFMLAPLDIQRIYLASRLVNGITKLCAFPLCISEFLFCLCYLSFNGFFLPL